MRLEDPQLERIVDHTGQRSAEEFGPIRRGKLADVQPESLEAGRVDRVIHGVKANTETNGQRAGRGVITGWLKLVTFWC